MKVQNGKHERRKLVDNDNLEPQISHLRRIKDHTAMTCKQALFLKCVQVGEAGIGRQMLSHVEDISLLS